jgi:hypothetical protein
VCSLQPRTLIPRRSPPAAAGQLRGIAACVPRPLLLLLLTTAVNDLDGDAVRAVAVAAAVAAVVGESLVVGLVVLGPGGGWWAQLGPAAPAVS